MDSQQIQDFVVKYYNMSQDKNKPKCKIIRKQVCIEICGHDDPDCQTANMSAFALAYDKYAKMQDKERLNDLIRYKWIIDKLFVLFDKPKAKKLKAWYGDFIFYHLFNKYYFGHRMKPRLHTIHKRIALTDMMIYHNYGSKKSHAVQHNKMHYKDVIEAETITKPNLQLFLKLWLEYDANKQIDIGGINDILPEVQRIIRMNVIGIDNNI